MDNTEERSYSEIFAHFAKGLSYEDIPESVIEKAKEHILDSVGVALCGTTMDWFKKANRVSQSMGGARQARVFGQRGKIPMANAGLANGAAIAATDYDDTDYWGGGGHMSRYVVATALTVGQAVSSSGKEVIKATVIGYEVASRIAAAQLLDRYGIRAAKATWGESDIAIHHKMRRSGGSVRSFTLGLFASAVEAGVLLGIDAQRLVWAQGLVGGLGLFLAQSHHEGADAQPLYPGWASHSGIVAALWARQGLTGPRLIYEGDKGFLSVIAGDLQDASRLADGLGVKWNTLNNVVKFYPAGHGTHHFIEALKSLIQEFQFRPDDIAEIECRAPASRIELHFEPKKAKLHPTPYSARFSLPYLLARLAFDGDLGPLSFTPDKVSDPKVLDLASRVKYTLDEQAWFGEKRGFVTVTLRDGRTFSRSGPYLLGLAERPSTRQDVLNKFRANAMLALKDERRVDGLMEMLENLDQVGDVNILMTRMVSSRRASP
ncbi:MAG: MmgE/PrpD family protein [Chloroflexi bacterium]|nr:MmgE/PrpD family protein [Chloroflexota bacterium]